jgi:hypothetical protein
MSLHLSSPLPSLAGAGSVALLLEKYIAQYDEVGDHYIANRCPGIGWSVPSKERESETARWRDKTLRSRADGQNGRLRMWVTRDMAQQLFTLRDWGVPRHPSLKSIWSLLQSPRAVSNSTAQTQMQKELVLQARHIATAPTAPVQDRLVHGFWACRSGRC